MNDTLVVCIEGSAILFPYIGYRGRGSIFADRGLIFADARNHPVK